MGFEYLDFSPYLLCCSLRQEPLPLSTGDVEIGTTHSCVTADAHAGPGKAGVLTETALLSTTEDNRQNLTCVDARKAASSWNQSRQLQLKLISRTAVNADDVCISNYISAVMLTW